MTTTRKTYTVNISDETGELRGRWLEAALVELDGATVHAEWVDPATDQSAGHNYMVMGPGWLVEVTPTPPQ